MPVYSGVVKNNIIVLPEGVQLEEGTEVEVRPLSSKAKAESSEEAQERAFEEKLLEAGLLTEIKTPPRSAPKGERTPIKVEGESLSQMIIRERR
jgi:hypothetical protein